MNPIFAILLYLAALVALLVGVSYLNSKRDSNPELRRKSVHVGMGLATLTFPLAFDSVLPVAILAVLSFALLLFLRRFPQLRCNDSLHCVKRRSGGEFYFIVGVLVAFFLTAGHPTFYAIAILTLTFADSAAALVGSAFSRANGKKTLHGSAAFFATVFPCAAIPLALIGQPFPIVTSLLFAISLTCVESLSEKGSDNFTIPFASSLFLLLPFNFQIIHPVVFLAFTIIRHDRKHLATAR